MDKKTLGRLLFIIIVFSYLGFLIIQFCKFLVTIMGV